MTEEYEEEGYVEPMPEINVDSVFLESQSDPRDRFSKKSIMIMSQQLIITTASHTKNMVPNFARNINYSHISRVNETRIKLKVLETDN